MKFPKIALAAASGVVLALTACGGGSSPATSTETSGSTNAPTTAAPSGTDAPAEGGELEKTDINFGVFATGTVTAHVDAGVEEGLYEAEGLNVEFVQAGATPSDIIPLMVNGQVDIAGLGIGPALNANAGGLDLVLHRLVNVNTEGGWELWASKQSGITDLQGLKGKRVGVIGLGGDGELLVGEALKTVGLSADDVTFVEVPAPATISTLAAGEVDAIWATGPFAAGLRANPEAPGTFLVDFHDVPSVSDFAAVGIWTTRDFAEENPNTLAAFLRAFDASADDFNGDPEKVRAALGKLLPDLPPPVLQEMAIYPIEGGPIDLARLQPQVDLMVADGLVPESDLAKVIWNP